MSPRQKPDPGQRKAKQRHDSDLDLFGEDDPATGPPVEKVGVEGVTRSVLAVIITLAYVAGWVIAVILTARGEGALALVVFAALSVLQTYLKPISRYYFRSGRKQ